jgi:hypothetical protein
VEWCRVSHNAQDGERWVDQTDNMDEDYCDNESTSRTLLVFFPCNNFLFLKGI